jgi:2,4-dienoyl-CoA reductase-like NADH-dependent reductase (Old Yellow Enzyme family)
VPGGLWLDDSVVVATLLAEDHCVDAIELTAGSSLQNPMYLFRGEAPIAEMAKVMPKPIRPMFRLLGRRFLPEYPFEEAYLRPYARQFLAQVNVPLILLGGITRLDTVRDSLAEGFAFVALGRTLLREPDFVEKLRAGATGSLAHAVESLCIHCNKCMPTIYRGTHCVLVPPEERAGGLPSTG